MSENTPEATPNAAPAGWYPSNDGREQRYWDGATWTEHVAPFVQRPQPPHLVTDQRDYGSAVNVLAWICAVLTMLYMLPWAVAISRGKSNALAVGLVNLLLGWTLIGWIAALVMACTAHQVAGIRQG